MDSAVNNFQGKTSFNYAGFQNFIAITIYSGYEESAVRLDDGGEIMEALMMLRSYSLQITVFEAHNSRVYS